MTPSQTGGLFKVNSTSVLGFNNGRDISTYANKSSFTGGVSNHAVSINRRYIEDTSSRQSNSKINSLLIISNSDFQQQ